MSKISRFLCFGSDSRYKNRYKKDLKHVKFSRNYFLDFFARYGWKSGIHKGNKKYFPEKVIQDEVNRIREKMKNFTANNIWNADETAIFVNDIGRNTFSPNDHVGRLINNDKQRVTGLYIDAAGNIHVPAIIDSAFPTGSKFGVIKESKKASRIRTHDLINRKGNHS